MARAYTQITRILNDRLVTLNSGAYAGKIKFQGAKFEPPAGQIWLSQTIMFAEPKLIGAFAEAGSYREQGIYQVSVFAPFGKGALAAADVADDLLDHYQRGTQLTDSGITVKVERSFRSTTVEESLWLHIPVSIAFWCYTPYRS